MTIPIACPQCKKEFEAPDELAGKSIRCTACWATVDGPRNAEVVDDEPAQPKSDDDAPLVAEVVRPGPEPGRGKRRKRSVFKVILFFGLVGGFLTCLAGAGGTAVWYFVIRDPGLPGDVKYLPDSI